MLKEVLKLVGDEYDPHLEETQEVRISFLNEKDSISGKSRMAFIHVFDSVILFEEEEDGSSKEIYLSREQCRKFKIFLTGFPSEEGRE